MRPETILKYAAPVPRYTSYPTANHFTPAVGADQHAIWLTALPARACLSLYLHVPFCSKLCWYCGCNTKATQRYEPVAAYVARLIEEIEIVAGAIPGGVTVADVHWGGGSPDILTPVDIARLDGALRSRFILAPDVDYAVEIDPRMLTEAQVAAFARAGVDRVSLGVQDFDPVVQKAIGREQSFAVTERAVRWFRDRGVRSVNVDLVYGLPHQTRASVQRTMEQVISLRPDRMALFGYAHIPSRMQHQRLIADADLPDAVERYGQASRAARVAERAGYVRIGLDHFALPTDAMARGPIHRNFQGYTTQRSDALIGLGASAISELPGGYVQNATSVHEYSRRVSEHRLASVRGIASTDDDRARAHVIGRLMCDFRFSASELERRFGAGIASTVLADAEALIASDEDHLLEETWDGFGLTARGRPFVRTIAACFDARLGQSNARHSTGV